MHGWGEMQSELNTMSKRGEWVEMGKLVTDDVLDQFAIVAPPGEVAPTLLDRYGDVVDQWMGTFGIGDADQQAEAMNTLQKGA